MAEVKPPGKGAGLGTYRAFDWLDDMMIDRDPLLLFSHCFFFCDAKMKDVVPDWFGDEEMDPNACKEDPDEAACDGDGTKRAPSFRLDGDDSGVILSFDILGVICSFGGAAFFDILGVIVGGGRSDTVKCLSTPSDGTSD